MKEAIINLLFKLLGQKSIKQYKIAYLFGATTTSHEARRKRWDNALMRMWKDKDMLDYLFYLSETDKENAWRGKVKKTLTQGSRIRTLYIVKEARRAYELNLAKKNRDRREQASKEIKKVEGVYNDITNVA